MRNSAPRPPGQPGRPSRRRAALVAVLGWPAWLQARALPVLPAPGLAEHLRRLLAGCGLPPASLGLCVSAVDGGRVLAALNADTPFVMASTAKIVTSLAALHLLGLRWRWRTHAFATGPIGDGRLLGDLLIVGGGDPRLSTAELRLWLQSLRDQGLRDVRGDLVVDRSAFHLQEQDHAGTPPPGPDRPHHARPDGFALQVVAVGATVGGTRVGAVGAAVHAAGHASGGSADAAAVALLWRDLGGRLGGRAREGDLSTGRADHTRLPLLGPDGEPLMPLSTHLSPTLAEVVHEINKTSNNVAARHLMLSLALGFPAQPATLARARERVQQWLQRQGLARGDIELDNGSGLSRAERGKPRALVHLLRRAWADEQSQAFIDSLPVAGVDGTLAHRLQGGAAMGQAFLKTGTLLDTRALAGYVRSRSGRVHAVAVFVNHPDAARATPSIDAVIEHLARHG